MFCFKKSRAGQQEGKKQIRYPKYIFQKILNIWLLKEMQQYV